MQYYFLLVQFMTFKATLQLISTADRTSQKGNQYKVLNVGDDEGNIFNAMWKSEKNLPALEVYHPYVFTFSMKKYNTDLQLTITDVTSVK